MDKNGRDEKGIWCRVESNEENSIERTTEVEG